MNWKTIWHYAKLTGILIYIILVIFLVGSLGIVTWLAMADEKAMTNSYLVNSLSLGIGLLSLPGAFIQLVTMVNLNKKKSYTATTVCPKCRHKVDLKMIED